MARFGFCGPTYQSQSLTADAERCINRYPETIESPGGKSAMALYPSPGLQIFIALGSNAVLGSFSCLPNGAITDRVFAVVQTGPNQSLMEVFQNRTFINRGPLTGTTQAPVTWAHNGTQLLICSGGNLYVFTFASNVITGPGAYPSGISQIAYCDGFGIALQANSNKVQVSALLDFTTWPGLGVAQISEFPDNIVSMIVTQRILIFLGRKATVPYSNTGQLNFPFTPISGVFIENGAGATYATAKLDNSTFWIDGDDEGNGIARRAQGTTPTRISNHSVETIWSTYPTIADAIGYAFKDQGHTFWHIYFPSGIGADGAAGVGASWRYDVATQMWHEVAYWNGIQGRFEAHHSQNHCFAWGMHLVGDWSSGNLYQMSIPVRAGGVWNFATDAGNPIRRVRVAPHISKERQYIFYHALEFDMETGLGPIPDLTGPSFAISQFVLQDANGVSWQVSISDAGIMQTEVVTINPPAPSVIILNDQAIAQQSWLLAISTQGIINDLTPVPYDPFAASILPMATSGNALSSGFYVIDGIVGTIPVSKQIRGPQLFLDWSNDGGHTWSNALQLDGGSSGKYGIRVIARRLGRARVRTFRLVDSDPVPLRFTEAYCDATDETGQAIFSASERMTKQLTKVG